MRVEELEKKYQNLMVIQSNNLVEAFYDSDLTATEHKLLRYAASKIKNNPDQFPDISFTVSEFLKATGIKSNNYHSKIIKIADELSKKRIKIQRDNEIGWFPWVQGIVYKEGVIYLTFNPFIRPLLLELDGQFTKYNYRYISDMKSGYSIRLFEILKQYAKIGKRKIEVETLKKMLGIGDKYEQYSQFKLRVLNQAKKELDQKKGLTFEYEEIKKGRKVTELIFFIHVKDDNLLKNNNEPLNEEQFVKEAQYLLEYYSFNIPEQTLRNWKKYGIHLLSNVLNEVKNRDIEHPAAYITKVLEAKYLKRLELGGELYANSELAKELIISFIERYTSHEPMPKWFLKQKFDQYMKGSFSQEEIDELWEKNGDFIYTARQKSRR